MSPELPLTSMPGDDEENLHRAIQLATENPRVGDSVRPWPAFFSMAYDGNLCRIDASTALLITAA
jgi:hypothetical protein